MTKFKIGDLVRDADLSDGQCVITMRVVKVGKHVVCREGRGVAIRYTRDELKYLTRAN